MPVEHTVTNNPNDVINFMLLMMLNNIINFYSLKEKQSIGI